MQNWSSRNSTFDDVGEKALEQLCDDGVPTVSRKFSRYDLG